MLLAITLASVLGATQAAAPEPTGRLTGRVVEDTTNAPVADARITLLPMGMPPAPGPPRQTTSDADGRYAFDGLRPGAYRVDVQKSGFAVRVPGPSAPQPPSVVVAAGDTRDAETVVLRRGGAISGRVLDSSGQPLVDARVAALRRVSEIPQSPILPIGQGAQTNDLGEFRVFGLPSGTYYLQASPRPEMGPMGATPQSRATLLAPTYFPGTADQTSAQPIEVTAGRTTADISFQMIRVQAFQVSGTVVDEGGAPVADAMVVVTPDRSAGGFGVMPGPPARVRTDSAGRFVVPNLQAGAYVVTAAAPVVTSSVPPNGNAATSSGISGGVSGSGGGTPGGGFVMTEFRNGVTTQYRADPAGAVHVQIHTENVTDVRIAVRTPQ